MANKAAKAIQKITKVVTSFGSQVVVGLRHEHKLPPYLILHKQPFKTKLRNDMHRDKFYLSRVGTSGERPQARPYGHDDAMLSKMNI